MFIKTTTKMLLEDSEINALKEAREQCIITEQGDCEVCPLLTSVGLCMGVHAEDILRGLK